MLYWAEGNKGRNSLRLTNSDPEMIRLFGRFLREFHGLDDAAIRYEVQFHAANGLAETEVKDWWGAMLGVPPSAVHIRHIDRRPRSARPDKARKTLPYGVMSITVHSTELVQRTFGAIQEYAGFDRPEWLD